ncbi:membrane protein insertion efficiency factor YidD [bacterium]|nr:membrane protein insertion efficiency factor YidD [bacterium]
MKNPLVLLLVFLIKFYQTLISPMFPAACKYYPSCSNYCVEALQRKGLVLGLFKGFWRILRCNPFSKGGYDPVE